MKSIGLISDTHGHVDSDYTDHLENCDEIWHGGDIGSIETIRELEKLGKPIRAVYGNIDGAKVRAEFPLNLSFECEGVKVLMTHIGGYPPKIYTRVRKLIKEHQPNLYICGHSHVLKIMPDRENDLIHMNPGACGHHGFHKFRTMILFDCDQGKLSNVRVVEIGKRGVIKN